MPMLAVMEEIERGELVARPLISSLLQETSVHVICRLGRHLTPAPLRLMEKLIAYLNGYERCLERANATSATRTAAEAAPARMRRMFFPQPPKDGFTGGPENPLSIEASRAQALPIRE
jgi:hypothetical protein